MPYRIDLPDPPDDALDRLVEFGALDVAVIHGGIAAILPDGVAIASVSAALGRDVRARTARGRDDGSVWVVHPRSVRVGRIRIDPADQRPHAGTLRMVDGPAFGTGLHATTALCLEALDDEVSTWHPMSALDIGTGSGVLALAALLAGVPRVVAIDIDADAVRVATENARLNRLTSRLWLIRGGPEALSGTYPLVLANVLTAPLIEMAPTLARRVTHNGRVVLSGIRSSVAADVESAYRRVGMRQIRAQTRDGWSVLTFHVSW